MRKANLQSGERTAAAHTDEFPGLIGPHRRLQCFRLQLIGPRNEQPMNLIIAVEYDQLE